MSNLLYVWTGDDYEAHRCRADQIGTPKPLPPTPVAPSVEQEAQSPEISQAIAELPPASMKGLLQAALRFARGADDYDAFLKSNPGFHQKVLLAAVRAPEPPIKQDLTVNISWLTSDRLAYRKPELELVQEAQSPTETSSTPVIPWREPAPDGLAKTMRDYDKQK